MVLEEITERREVVERNIWLVSIKLMVGMIKVLLLQEILVSMAETIVFIITRINTSNIKTTALDQTT